MPAALLDAGGSLPLTGLSVWLLLAAGGWLLASGLALLFSVSLFTTGNARHDPPATPAAPRRFAR